jgi:SAM-dependent MidA family methyltransferase
MRTLKDEIIELIRLDGPISVERYMELCLSHPTLGYYTTRDPFGAGGDFITAPEISQMFGELIGLWAAQVWRDMGSPSPVRLIELGPGRGTLMVDALRAIARAMPPMLAALDVHLVETSPVLGAMQKQALQAVSLPKTWHAHTADALAGASGRPAIVIANELLDALPIRQYVATPEGWRERLVGLGPDGGLSFGLAAEPSPRVAAQHPPGTVLELPLASDALIGLLADHVAAQGGAALLIDYGSATGGSGDTLQALSRHSIADVLADPGQADLTTHVDFRRAAALGAARKALAHGPATQGAFLHGLGIARRAETLKRSASPSEAAAIDAAVHRLTDMDPRGMGELFKVLALSHPSLTALPGFDSACIQRQ